MEQAITTNLFTLLVTWMLKSKLLCVMFLLDCTETNFEKVPNLFLILASYKISIYFNIYLEYIVEVTNKCK